MFNILADIAAYELLKPPFKSSPLTLYVIVFLLFSILELLIILKLFSSLVLLVSCSPAGFLIERYFLLMVLVEGDFDCFYLIWLFGDFDPSYRDLQVY